SSVLTRLAVPGCVRLAAEPTGFMPVQGAREHRAAFVPDDLLLVGKPNPEQAVKHLPRKLRGVPHVHHLETGHASERVRLVGARVAGDCRFRMTRSALFILLGSAARQPSIRPCRATPNRARPRKEGRSP